MAEHDCIKIGVIKPDNIGDAVLASPFLFELRKNFRNASITGFLSPAGKEVLDGLKVFDSIHTIDAKWLKYKKTNPLTRWLSALSVLNAINIEKFDILIGMRHQDRLTSLILSLSNAKRKVGYNVGGMGFGINAVCGMRNAELHEVLQNMELLKILKPGVKPKIKLGFSVSAQSEKRIAGILKKHRVKKYIVVHPVSGHVSKDWAVENYIELVSVLAKKYAVFIVGAKEDNRINIFGGKNVYNTAGVLGIKELGSLVKRSALVIGNDSGAVHIAAALGVKSLTIFSGAARRENWAAYSSKSHLIVEDTPCRNCQLVNCKLKVHECMQIPVETVLKTANNIIAGKEKKKIIQVL